MLSGLFNKLEKAAATALEAVLEIVSPALKSTLSGFAKLPKASNDINCVVFSFTLLSFNINYNSTAIVGSTLVN